MNPIRPLGPAFRTEAFVDFNGLPHGRITELDGVVHVFTAGLDELVEWFAVLPGPITRQPAGPGVVMLTLDTAVGEIKPALLRVHAPALETDQLDADLANAVRPHVA